MSVIEIYYHLKPYIPRYIQIFMRRRLIVRQRRKYADIWPIDEHTSKKPDYFTGWPEEKKFALVLTHDVDTKKGYERVWDLAMLEKSMGLRSSFGFVPEERYIVDSKLLEKLKNEGIEVYLHDFNHDGKLFSTYDIFKQRLPVMNDYIRKWGVKGFRAGAMHHNLEWIHELDIDYDMSTFDTDPFEPQPDAIQSIFPLIILKQNTVRSYIEMPYTMPQDFTLFILLKNESIDIWKQKLDWMVKQGAMVLLNTHPDYMCMGEEKPGLEEYTVSFYMEFMEYVKKAYAGKYWNALPHEVSRWVQYLQRCKK
jgi:hypothetical protein